MTPGEKIIALMRKRRQRIAIMAVAAVVLLVLAAVQLSVLYEDGLRLVPKELNAGDVVLLTNSVMKGYVCCIGLALPLAILVGDLLRCSRDYLLLEMWDRIQALEKQLAEKPD